MPYLGKQPAGVAFDASDIADNSITAAKIVDAAITIDDIGPNAVGSSEMADDAVGLNELSATGTTNSSTFLRGDNTWAVPPDNNTTYSVQDGQLSQNNFTDADHSKLNAIEASADVTDATNVTAAGALMDSEVTNLAEVKAFAASDYATAAQGTLATNALPKAGGTMTGGLDLNDNVKLRLGTGGDLQLYCDNSNSYIKDAGAGSLLLWTGNGTEIKFISESDGSKTMADMNADGSVDLYHNNAKKIETTSTGATVTGTLVESSPTNAVTTIVTNDNVAVRNFGSSFANVDTTWYKWDLPSSGTYLIGGNFRAIQWTRNGFCKVRLYNNTASAAINNSDRMLLESGNNSNTLNVGVCPTWVVTVTAATLIYLQGKSSSPTGSGGSGIQEDYNGNNECWHVRMY